MKRHIKETFTVAIPVILAQLVEMLVPFINTYLAAQISNEALAAAAITTTAYISFMGFSWGVTTVVGIFTAQKIGTKNLSNIGLNLNAGLITAIILSLFIMIIFYSMDKLWHIAGQEKDVVNLAYCYITGLIFGVIPDNLKYATFQYLISIGKAKIPLLANIIIIPIVYFFNDALIWGKYNLPKLGIFGIGLGTSISYWLIFTGMYIYLKSNKEISKHINIKFSLNDYKKKIKEMLKIGVPTGLMFMIEILFFMVIALMIGNLSSDALAAYQINTQWIYFYIIIAYSFAEVIIILVGKSYGARDIEAAKKYYKICKISILVIVSTAFVTFTLIPDLFIGFDIDLNLEENLDVINYARLFFIIASVALVIDSIRIVSGSVLRGISLTHYPMWSALISFWVIGLPVCYFLGFTLNLGPKGLLYGEVIAMLINCILLHIKINKEFVLERFLSHKIE